MHGNGTAKERMEAYIFYQFMADLWAQDRPKNRDENLTVAMRHRFGSAMGIMRCFLPYTVDPSECFARVNFIASDVDIFIGLVTEVKTAARHEARNLDENQEIRTDSSANELVGNEQMETRSSFDYSFTEAVQKYNICKA